MLRDEGEGGGVADFIQYLSNTIEDTQDLCPSPAINTISKKINKQMSEHQEPRQIIFRSLNDQTEIKSSSPPV